MSGDWRTRLQRLIDETPGLSMKGVSLRAKLGATAVHDILERGADPKISTLTAIATALGVPLTTLLGDEAPVHSSIPIVGFVSAGEGWTPIDNATGPDDVVDFDLGAHDAIGIEVRGDSMAPVYRNGDYLVCYRQFGTNADNCIGLDCVVRTQDGRHFVKILKRGSRPGRFNLKSYNPVADDIEDVTLSWVAPVAWIRRGGR
jgi:phage repressor protein C with HTH and peptisase S24 domain